MLKFGLLRLTNRLLVDTMALLTFIVVARQNSSTTFKMHVYFFQSHFSKTLRYSF